MPLFVIYNEFMIICLSEIPDFKHETDDSVRFDCKPSFNSVNILSSKFFPEFLGQNIIYKNLREYFSRKHDKNGKLLSISSTQITKKTLDGWPPESHFKEFIFPYARKITS